MWLAVVRTAATAGGAGNEAIAQLWSPASVRTVKVSEIYICANGTPTAGSSFWLRRTSAKGTVTTTVTPDANNDVRGLTAPPSGTELHGDWSVEPTLAGSVGLGGWTLGAVASAEKRLIYPLGGEIEIPAGQGLLLCTKDTLAFPVCDVSFKWD